MKARFTSLVVSVLLLLIVTGISGLLLSAEWVFLLLEFGHFLFLIGSALFLVLRFTYFMRREQFIYIFVGTVNVWLGLLALYLYWFGHMNIGLLQTMVINFLLGLIMLVDALLLKRKPYEQALNNVS